MSKIWLILVLLLWLAGCAEYPEGASYKKEGVIFTSYQLDMPWVDISNNAEYEFEFKNIKFNKKLDVDNVVVALNIRSDDAFLLEELHHVVTLEIWEIGQKDKLIYRQSSALNAMYSDNEKICGLAWNLGGPSIFLEAPAKGELRYIAVLHGYANNVYGVNLATTIENNKKYKLALSVKNAHEVSSPINAFVRLESSWK